MLHGKSANVASLLQPQCRGAFFVERLTPDGSIDTTFGVNGRSDVTDVDLCRLLFVRARGDGGVLVGSSRAVVALDALGAPETSFGVEGVMRLKPSVDWSSGLLLPDGGLMLAGVRLPPSRPGITLAKFTASGQRDALFGDGTGAVERDYGEAFFRISGLRHHVSAMASTVDGERLYLQVSLMRPDRGVVCAGGIASLPGDGIHRHELRSTRTHVSRLRRISLRVHRIAARWSTAFRAAGWEYLPAAAR